MKKIFAIALGVLALASCAREAAPVKVSDAREVKFTTNINTFTVKAGELEGKTVQVLAGAPINTGSAATVAGTSLTLVDKIYWQEDQVAPTTFVAYYPGNNQTSTSIEAYAITDDYGYHSTFMTATAKDAAPGTTVDLNFKHPFSKVVVNVTNNLTGAPAISKVTLEGVVLTADLDLAAETLTLGADKANIDAAAMEDGSFAAIIMPQTVKPTLVVTVGEKSYRFVLAADFTFVANKSYTAAVTLNDTTVPVEELPVDLTVTVTDWEDADAALAYEPEAEAAPEPLPVTELYLIGEAADCGWSIPASIALTKDENVFSVTANLAADKQFRFLASQADGAWFPSVVKDKATGKAVYAASQADWDANNAAWDHFSVAESGSYEIAVDILAKTVTLTRKGDVVLPPLDLSELYIIGDAVATGWSLDAAPQLTKTGDIFTVTTHLAANAIFRFVCQKDWYPSVVKGDTEGSIAVAYGGDPVHFTVAVAGTYTITIDQAARTISIVLDEADPEDVWYVIGNVYDDDPAAEAWAVDFPLTKDATGKWSITINVTGEFKLRAYSSATPDANKWNTTLGMWGSDPNAVIDIANTYGLATDAQGNRNIAFAETGQYTLVLDGTTLSATKL